MNLDHLHWPTDGWGYMPATEQVFDIFRWIEDGIQPRRLLEFGFHAGHSTSYQLESFPNSMITSFGVSREAFEGAHRMNKHYGNRFNFVYKATTDVLPDLFVPGMFDLALIDSNHKYSVVANEIDLVVKWKVPYLLFDNCEWDDVARAITDRLPQGKLIEEWTYDSSWKGTDSKLIMRLYHVPTNGV